MGEPLAIGRASSAPTLSTTTAVVSAAVAMVSFQ
jgi:hypothetical protein